MTGSLIRLAVGMTWSALRKNVSPLWRCLTAMATLPLWALARAVRRLARAVSSARTGGSRKRTRKKAGVSFVFIKFIKGCLSQKRSRRIFLPQLVQKPFAVGGHVPGVGPEAQVHAPPVVRHAASHQLGHQLVEIELAC